MTQWLENEEWKCASILRATPAVYLNVTCCKVLWCRLLELVSFSAVSVCFLSRGCSFPSPDKLAPFNGHFLSGSAWMEGEAVRSVHIKPYSEVMGVHTWNGHLACCCLCVGWDEYFVQWQFIGEYNHLCTHSSDLPVNVGAQLEHEVIKAWGTISIKCYRVCVIHPMITYITCLRQEINSLSACWRWQWSEGVCYYVGMFPCCSQIPSLLIDRSTSFYSCEDLYPSPLP